MWVIKKKMATLNLISKIHNYPLTLFFKGEQDGATSLSLSPSRSIAWFDMFPLLTKEILWLQHFDGKFYENFILLKNSGFSVRYLFQKRNVSAQLRLLFDSFRFELTRCFTSSTSMLNRYRFAPNKSENWLFRKIFGENILIEYGILTTTRGGILFEGTPKVCQKLF